MQRVRLVQLGALTERLLRSLDVALLGRRQEGFGGRVAVRRDGRGAPEGGKGGDGGEERV